MTRLERSLAGLIAGPIAGLVAAAGAIGGHAAQAAVVAAPGYAVHAIATPDTVEGGVVRRGDVILVGQGGFGPGSQQIVRLDGGAATTIATGFGSLGGFDLDAAGTLWVVDNCYVGDFGCAAATTGDTLYAIPDALTRTMPLAAADAEVLPPGSIPFAFDALVVPGAVLVSDAAGTGAGRVVKVVGTTATDLVTGLDLTAGLALQGTTLLVGDAVFDPIHFSTTGAVLRYGLDGTPMSTLVTDLAGASGLGVDNDGNVLVSGVGGFGASELDAVASDGSVTTRASGFGFSGDVYFDAARDEALVLDFGVQEIAAVCRDQDGDGVCDADDDCPTVADAGQTDTDGDGIGDACDPCPSGGAIAQGKVTITKLLTPGGDDTLALHGTLAAAGIDPVASGARIVVTDADGAGLDATIPPGAFDPTTKTGWKSRKGTFKNTADLGGLLGTIKVKLRAQDPGSVSFVVQGKHGSYQVDHDRPPVRIAVAAGGQCGEATFDGSECLFKPRGKLICQ